MTHIEAERYRQLARDFHFMARSLPLGERRSVLLEMAEEWDRLADQQEHAADLRDRKMILLCLDRFRVWRLGPLLCFSESPMLPCREGRVHAACHRK